MRIFITIFLLLLSINLFSQNKIIGHYRNSFGSRIKLNSDSTFEFTWHFDLSASWTKGTWTLISDSVYFDMVPIYDTITSNNSNDIGNDKLILSTDQISQKLTPEEYAAQGLSSGGQNRIPFPEKLYFKRGRLYEVKNGQLIKKKLKGFWTKKKFRPWFFKSDD